MQRLQIFQVDAFSDQIFKGNPAAVVLVEGELDETRMQLIAAENNLSETARNWRSISVVMRPSRAHLSYLKRGLLRADG
jgi:PhzF family phenazine biosynthesis protein